MRANPSADHKHIIASRFAGDPVGGGTESINADDPAYFGGYVNENYAALRDALSLSDAVLYRLARNSFKAPFLPETEKAALIEKLDAATGHQQPD